jgi:hypothetical protein
MAAKLKNPELFDIVSRFVFVASSMSTTVAFGITALLASATVPLIDPVAFWPSSDKLQNKNPNNRPVAEKARDVPTADRIASDMESPPKGMYGPPN